MKSWASCKVMLYAALLCISAAAFLSSCKKDDDNELIPPPQAVIEEEPCEPIPYFQGLGFRPAILDSINVKYPVVNPKNPDEFIFQVWGSRKIYKLNVVTGEKNLLVENGLHYRDPDWGNNGWLLYTAMSNLYKVKSNGDSLTQITFNSLNVRGKWNPSGDKYTYVISNSQGQIRVIANMQDAIIDTLPSELTVPVVWAAEDTFFFHGGMYVMGQQIPTMLYDIPTTGGSSITALSSTEFIDLTNEIIKVNVQTGEVNVTPGPDTICKRYMGIEYSPQKQKLLSRERYRRLMPNGIHEYIRDRMVWLNLDGTVHEVIDIAPFFSE